MNTLKRLLPFVFGEYSHPYKTVLFFGLGASFLAFSAFLVLFLTMASNGEYTLPQMPWPFVISTLVIVLSTHFAYAAYQGFSENHLTLAHNMLGLITFGLLLFGILQYLGWEILVRDGVYFSGRPVETLLYILSGLHLLHIVGMLLYVLHMWREISIKRQDDVQSLVYTTEPYVKVKYQMLQFFWIFLEVLWLLIFGIIFVFMR